MNVNLLHDRILVKRETTEKTSTGGIFIAESAAEKNHQGDVIAIGKGRITEDGQLIELTVKVGDKVMYHPQAGIEVRLEGDAYLVMKETDIFCIFEG